MWRLAEVSRIEARPAPWTRPDGGRSCRLDHGLDRTAESRRAALGPRNAPAARLERKPQSLYERRAARTSDGRPRGEARDAARASQADRARLR